MEPDVLSQEQQEFIHNRLLERLAAIEAVVPWPNLHRSDLDAFLAFAWKKDQTPWTVSGQDHWLTAQAANDFDFQKALESDDLRGFKIGSTGLVDLFDAFDALTPPHSRPVAQRFLNEKWTAATQLRSQTFMSHFAESTTTISSYLVFVRTDKGAQVRCVFANSAAHASRVARSAWKKEGHRQIAFFATLSRQDLAGATQRLEDVRRGYNPDLLWPKTTREEFNRASDAFVASRRARREAEEKKPTDEVGGE